ncbi:MAG: Eco57I restriction-modification methylase domain-containing protein, partial [Thermoflexales bacterium]|nr:Eco57I restriction-modification methylase domain-containing protein [Thermoflexales bacterium]
MFGEVLLWNVEHGSQRLDVDAPLQQTVTLERIAEAGGVRVFALQLDRLPNLTTRRAIFRKLRPVAEEHLVVYFDKQGDQALFVRPQPRYHDANAPTELRTLPYERNAPARTTLEQLGKLSLPHDAEPSLSQVRQCLDEAFKVEAVTERFFEDYKRVFEALQAELHEQTKDARWAHDYALQLLNRLLFLYFIQRKRYADGGYWLGNDRHFVRHFWKSYREQAFGKDAFFRKWLQVLFFEAFNRRFQAGSSAHAHFPPHIREALAHMPYLNGGLFTENHLDTKHSSRFNIPDAFFEQLFDAFNDSTPGFLERYNFTVSESTPLDVEVAVDPEMLGKVYESLVNLTERGRAVDDQRGRAGIFYTPRVEIDLMCRLALVDALANRLDVSRDLLYEWVFAVEPDQKQEADQRITERNLWSALDAAVRSLTICDPACGSGAFLVGMLQVLDDLQARCAYALGREETPYDRRRRIIGEQLYGVDAMDWAVHVAELRLWLQLTVETELSQPEAQLKPLLPNLSFKLRQGDSLVQEVGDVLFGLRRSAVNLPPNLQGRITQLKADKLRFYQGSSSMSESALRHAEVKLFHDILQHRIKALGDALKDKRRALANLPGAQLSIGVGGVGDHDGAADKHEALAAEIATLEAEHERLRQAQRALNAAGGNPPFVWDIAFVEIFGGQAQGFDIVIGNPPYVRKQMIAPPSLSPEEFGGEGSREWEQQKQNYREKLQQLAVRTGLSSNGRSISGWADLYVYFYAASLRLLGPKGTLCFITSNSWLDVGYGRDLQAFLLQQGRLRMVIDNSAERSFSRAEVNTVIALVGNSACHDKDDFVRFILFKHPFIEVPLGEVFKAADNTCVPITCADCCILPVSRSELWNQGLSQRDSKRIGASLAFHEKQRYEGSKWGKYLRASNVFHLLMAHTQMIPVRQIAVARLGVTTGANDFFFVKRLSPGLYLTTAFGEPREVELPDSHLLPVMRSVNECKRYSFRAEDAAYWVLIADRTCRDRLVRDYIQAAEKAGIHRRPFFRGRRHWYELGELLRSRVVVPEIVYRRYFFAWNLDSCALNKNFYGYQTEIDERVLFGLLNFSFSFLYFELTGRKPGAGASGINVSIANELPIVTPSSLGKKRTAALIEAVEQMQCRVIYDLDEELQQA